MDRRRYIHSRRIVFFPKNELDFHGQNLLKMILIEGDSIELQSKINIKFRSDDVG